MSIPEKLLKLLKFQFPEKTKPPPPKNKNNNKKMFLVNKHVHGLYMGKKMIKLLYDTTSFTVFGLGK